MAISMFFRNSCSHLIVLVAALTLIVGCGEASKTASPDSAGETSQREAEVSEPGSGADREPLAESSQKSPGIVRDLEAVAKSESGESAPSEKAMKESSEASPRVLPSELLAESTPKQDGGKPAEDGDKNMPADTNPLGPVEDVSDEPPSPEEIALTAFDAPPEGKRLSKRGGLWIDRDKQRVYIDGYVAIDRGALEMLACPVGTKEHESLIAALPQSSEVHAALLAIGANPGTPVRFRPEYLPPTGQVIRVWVTWLDEQGEFHVVDARKWIQKVETEKEMEAEFVFAGSSFWQDPEDGKEYYRADAGDMICVSNFSSAMIDVSINSSADADSLLFVPFEGRLPARFTPVRMVLVPVPPPSDDPEKDSSKSKRLEKPTKEVLPAAKAPKENEK